MDTCSATEEKIARGEALDRDEAAHVATCPRCGAVAADYSLLDAALEALDAEVPTGFADRVMARVAGLAAPTRARWFERRAVQIVLAHAAAICTVLNVARFLARILVPDIALGGTP